MPALVRINIDYADEFDVYGFMGFGTEQEATRFIEELVDASQNVEEFAYFGSNEYIGTFNKNQFVIQKINAKELRMLAGLFPAEQSEGSAEAEYNVVCKYGIANTLLNSILDHVDLGKFNDE